MDQMHGFHNSWLYFETISMNFVAQPIGVEIYLKWWHVKNKSHIQYNLCHTNNATALQPFRDQNS